MKPMFVLCSYFILFDFTHINSFFLKGYFVVKQKVDILLDEVVLILKNISETLQKQSKSRVVCFGDVTFSCISTFHLNVLYVSSLFQSIDVT
jgi:hypothetical protein